MISNGARVARTFVAELGSARGDGYRCRAKCTRCVPAWLGPVHDSLPLMVEGVPPVDAMAEVMDAGRRDVLAHVDRRHGGKLRG